MRREVIELIQPALRKHRQASQRKNGTLFRELGLLMCLCEIARIHQTSSICGKMTSLCYKNVMSAVNREDTEGHQLHQNCLKVYI